MQIRDEGNKLILTLYKQVEITLDSCAKHLEEAIPTMFDNDSLNKVYKVSNW